jgi:hypothetical protein
MTKIAMAKIWPLMGFRGCPWPRIIVVLMYIKLFVKLSINIKFCLLSMPSLDTEDACVRD